MDVLMPQLGETVMEGTVAAWHKTTGDAVEKGETLLDIETDKAATEIEAPESGVLASIEVAEGETVQVGTVLAVISTDGEEAAESAPSAPKPAERKQGRAAAGLPEESAGNRLSPVVRRLIKEHGVDITDIRGTGRGGRITRRDVLEHVEKKPGAEARVERIPFNRIRKITAERMQQSKAMSPHVLQTIEADFSGVEKVRRDGYEEFRKKHGYSLSYLPFVACALCEAIAKFPKVNATVDGDELVVYPAVDLAVAIDLDFEGLVAPVIRNSAELKVTEFAERIHDLAEKAKAGKLTADEMRGGTYTLSNPGPYGTLFTAPIINQPQVAILSMDAVSKRPVVVESEQGDTIEIRPTGILAQSFDHRAFDGAYSAAFLQQLKTNIEETDWSDEL